MKIKKMNFMENDYQQVKYEKNYDADEEAKRFDIFKENLAFVEEHNAKFAKGETTFEVGINHFADQTEDEKSHSRGLVRPLGLGKKEE